MARIATEFKRLVLRVLAKKVSDGESPSMSELLSDLALARFEQLQDGSMRISSSGDGFSGSFAIPSAKDHDGITPGQMAALISELMDLRDKSDAFLTKLLRYGLDADYDTIQEAWEVIDENGWPSPLPAVAEEDPTVQEPDLANRMLAQLVAKQQSMGDYTLCGIQGGAWS